ncbi:MAG: metallophosphoesterase [Cytophagales bacterium]|nr:metallophosphoesterase [Cytophagales bacterium]
MKRSLRNLHLLAFLLLSFLSSTAQQKKIPKIYSNIQHDKQGFYFELKGRKLYALPDNKGFTPEQFTASIKGTKTGLRFDFRAKALNGTLYYGFIPTNDSKYPQPVYFAKTAEIIEGVAEVNLKEMKGRYDMINWTKEQKGILGYRVMSSNNNILYDGKINFDAADFLDTDGKYHEIAYGKKVYAETKPFVAEYSVIEGPLICNLTHQSAVIFLKTNVKGKVVIRVNGKKFSGKSGTSHEIEVNGLSPDTEYAYTVLYGNFKETYAFRTAPAPGSRTEFSFSYASDSRSGNGGGERNLYGTNVYIMKKIMALNMQQQVRFMQFSGDLITGLSESPNSTKLEYANWKRAIEPFARYMPVVTTMGNHEAVLKSFYDETNNAKYSVDNFPFDKVSAEAVYRQEFVNPMNGPDSEDGSAYDPDEKNVDFPSYKESVFYYIYDNLAMVVLNSNYWYAPTTKAVTFTGGNIHGYIMDNQLEWFKATISTLENDSNIDHIFVTVHTPFFPNGGHVADDMWYNGENAFRPLVGGKRVAKGIIERRDELLDVIVNQSKKTRAILTGDEHNYARTKIGPETKIYPKKYFAEKIELSRDIWQVNNGAAGAPYYAQEKTPWSEFVEGFTTQNALVIFYVHGEKLSMKVLNPDTLEEVDEMEFE